MLIYLLSDSQCNLSPITWQATVPSPAHLPSGRRNAADGWKKRVCLKVGNPSEVFVIERSGDQKIETGRKFIDVTNQIHSFVAEQTPPRDLEHFIICINVKTLPIGTLT